ncbi:hypothetical protein ABIA18_002719 [Sinorhizobium fredii]
MGKTGSANARDVGDEKIAQFDDFAVRHCFFVTAQST